MIKNIFRISSNLQPPAPARLLYHPRFLWHRLAVPLARYRNNMTVSQLAPREKLCSSHPHTKIVSSMSSKPHDGRDTRSISRLTLIRELVNTWLIV